jgi:hypothetical protein
MDNPTEQQKRVTRNSIEKHHAILFLIGADNYKYGKLIKDMKNDVFGKKDTFHVLSKWKKSK